MPNTFIFTFNWFIKCNCNGLYGALGGSNRPPTLKERTSNPSVQEGTNTCTCYTC